MKQPKTGYKEPASLVGLSEQIQQIHASTSQLGSLRRNVVKAHKNIAGLRQQASDDGVPGSSEPFNTPVFALEDYIGLLVQRLEEMKLDCQSLRNRQPEDW